MISSVGFHNLLWFIGRVEAVGASNENPGCVKVRVYGIHPPASPSTNQGGEYGANSLEGVETNHLPWAPVVNGSGGGASLVPPVGEMVMGFFADGRDAQYPVVIGTVPGLNMALPKDAGYDEYGDPYVKTSQESVDNFGTYSGGVRPQNSSQASAVEFDNIVSKSDIPSETGDGREFREIDPVSGGTPDKNLVLSARSEGSNIQVGGDGKTEHIVLSHSGGNHIQIDPNGNIKLGAKGTAQTWAKNIQHHADGSVDIHAGENCSVRVKNGDATILVEGDINIVSRNNINFTASGEIKMNAGEGIFARGSKVSVHATADNVDIAADQRVKMQSSSGSIDILSGEDTRIESAGSSNIKSSDNVNIQGSEVSVKASTVYLDDIVRMAEGGSSDAASAEGASIPGNDKMEPPEGRSAIGERSVTDTAPAITRADSDDAEPQSQEETPVIFGGAGLEKGIKLSCKLQSMGYTKAAAAALAGNAMHESAGFTADIEIGGTGRGWLQWTGSRRETFENYATENGYDFTSDEANYGYMMYELAGNAGNHWTNGGSTQQFREITDLDEATSYFMNNWLRPNEDLAHYDRRLANAQTIYDSEC